MLARNSRPARNDGERGLLEDRRFQRPQAQRPETRPAATSLLIEGGFGNRPRPRASRARRHKTVRAAAPLLVPLALALTLGVILAVSSSGAQTTHVNQTTSNSGRP
jgi:hypothetical protein